MRKLGDVFQQMLYVVHIRPKFIVHPEAEMRGVKTAQENVQPGELCVRPQFHRQRSHRRELGKGISDIPHVGRCILEGYIAVISRVDMVERKSHYGEVGMKKKVG